jgi:hypothetical protein
MTRSSGSKLGSNKDEVVELAAEDAAAESDDTAAEEAMVEATDQKTRRQKRQWQKTRRQKRRWQKTRRQKTLLSADYELARLRISYGCV